jgi:hypothetical protein
MYSNGEASNSPQIVAKKILIRLVVRVEMPRVALLDRVIG